MMKVAKTTRTIIAIVLISILAGCASIKNMIAKIDGQKDAKEKEIAALRVEFDQKLEKNRSDHEKAMKELAEAKDAQMGGAGNSFYALDMLFRTIIKPSRTDLLFHNYSDEGWQAIGRIMPDYKTMMEINDRLKRELDETQTSLADLQKNHDAVIAQNQKLVDTSKALSSRILELENEKGAITEGYNKKINDATQEYNALLKEKVALETERAKDAESVKAMKMKFSLIAGALAAAALAGAIWSPVFKEKFGLFSAICAGVAVGIWYVTPFIVGVVASVSVVLLLLWATYKYHVSDKANDAFVNFIDDKMRNDPKLFTENMKSDLEAWMTKYKKDKTGSIITVPDKSVMNLVVNKQIENNKI